jgi:2-dehydropantoate 2-reductase
MVMSESAILIWGAGAIGGTLGAWWARAGHDIAFVDVDADHVDAMKRSGLRIEGPIDTFQVPVRAMLPEEVAGTYRRILLCVKAHHTEKATVSLAAHLAPDGYVASFQNGLNELVIAEIVGAQRTLGAFINFGADYLSPGVIHYGGHGAFVVGELDGRLTPRLQELHELGLEFEPGAILTDNIMGYLWGKLGYGALLFATALTNASICDALAAPEPRRLYRRIAGETVEVARSLGMRPIGFNGYDPAAFGREATDVVADASFQAMVAHNARSAKTHSGIWRDLAVRKRQTEADAQLGPIVTFARQQGLRAPTVEALIGMVHEIEQGRRPLAWENLAELDRRTSR